MLDLFGREVKRGDVIVYGHSSSRGNVKFAESKLGVISNILPRKNGKPKRNVSLTITFIIIDKDTLSDKWRKIYEGACKAFKI